MHFDFAGMNRWWRWMGRTCFSSVAMLVAYFTLLLPRAAWAQRPFNELSEMTVDGSPIVGAGEPSTTRAYLGLVLWDQKIASGETRCVVRLVRPGPVTAEEPVEEDDVILSLNETEIRSTREFRAVMARMTPGAEARLRIRRAAWGFRNGTGSAGGTVKTITTHAASWAEWAAPTDYLRQPKQRVSPDEVIKLSPGSTRFERFIQGHLEKQGIREPVDALYKYLVGTVEKNYAAHMLDRVAYAFYRPTRLAELQTAITEPFARIVDNRREDPYAVAGLVLTEAAKNLDVTFSPQVRGRLDLATPRQALRETAGMTNRAYTHLERAFGKLDPTARADLELSAGGLLDERRWPDRLVVRARQASMAVDYASLFAAAGALVSWQVSGEPPAGGDQPRAAVPKELAGAIKGDVWAVERIDGHWFVYGGPGPNEYDLSRIDVVIDPGGNDVYRYTSNQRPKVQLVIDWDGNDVYVGENGAAGPASAMLGVSILIDRKGNDRYEGGERSCGAGFMGIGLLLDLGGNDIYQGTKWSLGAAKYGVGGIVDLGPGSDVYTAHESSEGIGGPRGFGLILDQTGNELYRVNGPRPSERGIPGVYWSFSQGVGKGDYWPDIGAYDTGGIGLLCDLGGDDVYEVGEFGQGMGFYFGLGILYDRSGRDHYSGSLSTQGAAAHGGVGILADDAGDDTYLGAIARAQDSSLALLIDRAGNDSYQNARGAGSERALHPSNAIVGALGVALNQGIAWLIDLDGHDRYSFPASPPVTLAATAGARLHQVAAYASAGMGESAANGYNYKDCQCFSLSVLLDVGGTPDYYSRSDRGDGMAISTGKSNPWKPEYSNLHGLFIDTNEKVTLWP